MSAHSLRPTLDLAAGLLLGGPVFCPCSTRPFDDNPSPADARKRLHRAADLAGVKIATSKIAPGLIRADVVTLPHSPDPLPINRSTYPESSPS